MSNPDQPPSASSSSEQSPGTDPRSKRNSGLFAFFKWFKPGSRESIDSASRSSSQESVSSIKSNKSAGTVASFNFVQPSVYEKKILTEKCVQIGPETDTYKARLKQRDKRRESDKNVTLRKKYNLFFNRESLLRPEKFLEDEENSKSLPLMTRTHIMEVEPQKNHRRTNSESSKVRRAGAYVHVKGKRKAPQPPGGGKLPLDTSSTASLKQKKRVAPTPPPPRVEVTSTPPKVEVTNMNDSRSKGVLSNDYLKLDHGVLKPVKEDSRPKTPQDNISVSSFNALSPSSSRTSFVEAPVSPRPWYKRHSASKEMLNKKESKYEAIERLPEVQFMRNSTLDLTLEDSLPSNEKEKKKDEKRKSGMSFLTNISELDREATEIIKNKAEYEKKMGVIGVADLGEIPEFMKPKEAKPSDSWVSPKRRSARDLIAKFNAITNVTKVTVFGASHKDKYFGKQTSLDETRQRQEQLLESHKKRIEEIDKKKEDRFSPLMKSESASAVKLGANKDDTPKMERKSWKCPKCNLENEYWRIICHVCSAIKPYFDDFSSSGKINGDTKSSEVKTSSPVIPRKEPFAQNNSERLFERAKTQIGFSALANYSANNKKKMESTKNTLSEDNDRAKVDDTSKKEEREKLKKMLIEMKNSLPKRKSNILIKQNSRTSIIMENPEEPNREMKEAKEEFIEKNKDGRKEVSVEKTQEEKVAEILIGTTETIYENIKVRKNENLKPIKVSSAAQTSAVVKQVVPENSLKKLIENHKANNVYEPMKVKDFEDIYSDKNGKSVAKIYANLAQNDELSLFFNVPKNISALKNNLSVSGAGSSLSQNNVNFNVNTDTIEINRLLRKLETSIAKGDMTEASIFAKELAQLKVNCSVVRQKPQGYIGKKKGFQIEMYVEDKVSHRGPFPIDVIETQTVTELKQQISREFEIPVEVQRWILGKELVTDDSSRLKDHKITEGCPVFLYLVASEKRPPEDHNAKVKAQPPISNSNAQNFNRISTNKPEISKSIKSEKTNISIMPMKLNINKSEFLNHELKEKANFKDINQEKKFDNNENNIIGFDNVKVDAPKVVNVIPKSLDSPQDKAEIVKIIPIQKDTEIKAINKQVTTRQKSPQKTSDSALTQLPVSVTEIKVDIRPYSSRSQSVDSKDQKTALVMAKATKVEVLQIPPVVLTNSIGNQHNSNRSSVVFTSNKTEQLALTPLDTRLKQESTKEAHLKNQVSSKVTDESKKVPKESSASNTTVISTKIDETSSFTPNSNNISRAPQISIGIYPNLSKLSPNVLSTVPSASNSVVYSSPSVRSPQASIVSSENPENAQAPMAQREQDLEDYDLNTLKPSKEWECHLCTLLNPTSSNICAVCATVRLTKASLKRSNKKKPAPQPQKDQTYLQLVNLDSADLVPNADVFECLVCFLEVSRGKGVTLRECLHQFCKDCLARTVEFSEDAEVKCPFRDDEYSCNIALQDREIKALVTTAVYDQYLAKSVAQAENKMEKTFHCKTPDCKGWCIFEDNVNEFRCPVCRRTNCLTCQAIHTGLNCRQYQERMKDESEIDEEAKRTKDFLEEMVEKGEAIACPTCKVILMKKWGCDWLRCSMCKTEICWVTRGPRWGPGGKGDTSGGCQCGLNGVKCHPKCNYCH